MKKKNILVVVGTRPNFIKVTQFKRVAEQYPELDIKIVHTGQHYDAKMADVFFQQFKLEPDFFLNIKPSSPSHQMAEIMQSLERLILDEYQPDMIIVPGDVNSTFAAALAANKMNIPLGHLESGLRSFDRSMPEEINRLLTDEITDAFFVTEQSGIDNLANEKKPSEKVHFVGNTMIDTLVAFDQDIRKSDILEQLQLVNKPYALMTMHRPATVDNEEGLVKLIDLIGEVTKRFHLVFPIHPRTINRLKQFNLEKAIEANKRLILCEPMGYFSFQKLVLDAKVILTDSGGIQEESTFRMIPCLTLRPNTERPSTTTIGSNTLVTFDPKIILDYLDQMDQGTYKQGAIPPLWDGKATDRVMEIIASQVK